MVMPAPMTVPATAHCLARRVEASPAAARRQLRGQIELRLDAPAGRPRPLRGSPRRRPCCPTPWRRRGCSPRRAPPRRLAARRTTTTDAASTSPVMAAPGSTARSPLTATSPSIWPSTRRSPPPWTRPRTRAPAPEHRAAASLSAVRVRCLASVADPRAISCASRPVGAETTLRHLRQATGNYLAGRAPRYPARVHCYRIRKRNLERCLSDNARTWGAVRARGQRGSRSRDTRERSRRRGGSIEPAGRQWPEGRIPYLATAKSDAGLVRVALGRPGAT